MGAAAPQSGEDLTDQPGTIATQPGGTVAIGPRAVTRWIRGIQWATEVIGANREPRKAGLEIGNGIRFFGKHPHSDLSFVRSLLFGSTTSRDSVE